MEIKVDAHGYQRTLRKLAMNNVALVTDGRLVDLAAGDWMQARRTAEEIIRVVPNARHYLLDGGQTVLQDTQGGECFPLDILKKYEVVHLLPCSRQHGMAQEIRTVMMHRAVLVGSPVSWESFAQRLVLLQNGSGSVNIVKYVVRRLMPSRLKNDLLKPYDILLPNSKAESQRLKNYYALRPAVKIIPIPNGFDRCDASTIENDGVKTRRDDYVLYPGVISPRKNQLGFIRATKKYLKRVVFLGGPLPGQAHSLSYYKSCVDQAPKTWEFLGAVEHNSAVFRQAFCRAAVACLASSCETPGIALLEAAAFLTRSAATREGSTREYLNETAEYLAPYWASSIRTAVGRALDRGPLTVAERSTVILRTWEDVATHTLAAYENRPLPWH